MINKILLQGDKGRQLIRKLFLDPRVPAHISRNYINLSNSDLSLIQNSLEANFFSKEPDGYISTEVGKNDLNDHLIKRLEHDRKYAIPWLDSVKSLKDVKILEIGCGTGASTIALAEQGAIVTAIDIDAKALTDAKMRAGIYNLKADFHHMNSTDVPEFFSGEKFDFIIFWACLEHMTHKERMLAMKVTWDMLPSDGLWCLIETPNRLWFYDSHTSGLPFFQWLPDDLAIRYSRFSQRHYYNEAFVGYNDEEENMLQFNRWGRGVSFHEFELAMEPIEKLNVISCMTIFHMKRRILSSLKWKASSNYRYESFIRKLYPNISRGWFQPYLDLIIQKD